MNENEEVIRMDCSRFEEALDDLDRPGTPGLVLREAALAHAEGCSHCAQVMTDAEALDFSLRSLAVRDTDLQSPPRVEAVLLQELRRQKAAVAARKGRWRMAVLAAAIVLLALGLSVRHGALTGAGEKISAGTGAANYSVSTPGTGRNSSLVEIAENVSSDSQGTEFISLPYATDPATLEGGTVVRVELSRSVLASMGMPVADASATDRIPADIMLSEDGAPQAIRLVGSASLDQ
jgi:hypothetical protein